jgi:AcrR family transcriptional regulator
MATTRGRPRRNSASSTGQGTASDILAAAARLFCTVGYGSTSTHRIAAEAGIRQASIYHYFAGKHQILLELLLGTVQPSLLVAQRLLVSPEPASARLWALCVSDVRLLSSGTVNLGSLYLLPELADPRLAEFHARREELRAAYALLVAACPGVEADPAGRAAYLVLALVESVILRRRKEAELDVRDLAPRIADAALRTLELDQPTVESARSIGAGLVDPRLTNPA